MRVSYATEPAPGGRNEDQVVAGAEWAVVLDGATQPAGLDGGCSHGVGWLVRALAGALAVRLTAERGEQLSEVLAAAIGQVRGEHGGCDLTDPDSPSATVTMLRRRGAELDWLVLCDSPLLLDLDGGLRVVRDDRVDHLPDYSLAGVRAARNRPGGFWVAAARPEAAYEALTGTVPAAQIRRAALFTDGATRLVERFGRTDWAGLLDLLDHDGPDGLIAATRRAERAADVAGPPGRRSKVHDDATAVLVRP